MEDLDESCVRRLVLLQSAILVRPARRPDRLGAMRRRICARRPPASWQLEEWHLGGQVLRPLQADGRWSNHAASCCSCCTGPAPPSPTWGGASTDDVGHLGLPIHAHADDERSDRRAVQDQPDAAWRADAWFKIRREPGKVVLEGAGDDRRETEGPFLTFMQKGQISRKWRRVVSTANATRFARLESITFKERAHDAARTSDGIHSDLGSSLWEWRCRGTAAGGHASGAHLRHGVEGDGCGRS